MPKITTAVFAGGTTLLIAGAAVAAMLSPSGARMLHMADAPGARATTAVATTSAPAHPSAASTASTATSPASASTSRTKALEPNGTATTSSPHASKPAVRQASKPAVRAAANAPITYTVHRGDTLSGLAAWFKLHGYGELYAANAKVIGVNPNLIRPGERITIGSHVMTVQGPA